MLKALEKSPKALILIVPLVLNGGPKEATLELLAQRLYRTLREENNLLFFEELKLLQVA